jgi:hypothetical protein
MQYIDYGDWVAYKPTDHPVLVLGAMHVQFCRRVSDSRDWYEFQQSELLSDNVSIKLTLFHTADDQWSVGSTATDASLLFPARCKLIEIASYDGAHEDLRGQFFDLETGEFTKPPPPAPVRI